MANIEAKTSVDALVTDQVHGVRDRHTCLVGDITYLNPISSLAISCHVFLDCASYVVYRAWSVHVINLLHFIIWLYALHQPLFMEFLCAVRLSPFKILLFGL